MKKVIFIGGTAYSGSTFFDMTLANDPKGFSLGEVSAIFYPNKKKHLNVDAFSDDIDWRAIRDDGANNLYQNIFSKFPDIEYIVDSSKSQLWIHDRTKELKDAGIGVENILIWKSPLEFEKSMMKRGQGGKWIRSWINYHKYYMEMVQDWRSVKYSDFAKNKETLRHLCKILDIGYFEGKENFWEKKQHTLFGNASAKVHLFDEDEKVKNAIEKEEVLPLELDEAVANKKHRRIYYDDVSHEEEDSMVNDERFKPYIDVLNYVDIHNKYFNACDANSLKSSISVSFFYKLAQIIKLKLLGHITNKI